MCIADAYRVLPVDNTEAVTPGSSLCRSVIRSPTLISMGLRKNRHFSFLEGNGTSRTRRPYLYFKDTSATEWGKEICCACISCCVLWKDHYAHFISFTQRDWLWSHQQGAAMQHTERYDYVDAVAVLYHWGAGVCCRKVLDNFQVGAVSVEPEEKVVRKEGGKKKTLSADSICS